METPRVRVVFDDRRILNKSETAGELRQSWILIKAHQETISDFASYLLNVFNLHDVCPRGLVLYMDDFVLPPFESISILKDNDIVRIKKRKGISSEKAALGDGGNFLELEVADDKQRVATGVKLLTNGELFKETGVGDSESKDNQDEQCEDVFSVESYPNGIEVSKKRKASKKLQSSKKKRNKVETGEKCQVAPARDERSILSRTAEAMPTMTVETQLETGLQSLSKGKQKKKHSTSIKAKKDSKGVGLLAAYSDRLTRSPRVKRSCQLQENRNGCVEASGTPDETEKFPSRSARRKKAKRRWLRELKKAEMSEQLQTQLPEKVKMMPFEMDNHTFAKKHQKSDQGFSDEHLELEEDVYVENGIFPIVVRPGHIRFEPLSEADDDHPVCQNNIPETFAWNGITNKKKGQKWGTEKNASCRKQDYKSSNEEFLEIEKPPEIQAASIEEAAPVEKYPTELDKLGPLTGSPKEGDVIAYRLIELSSSWTPELSSLHVGKVSWFKPESHNILLLPVPEYPITVERKGDDEAAAPQPDTSLYGEDGSLEIDYLSLVDLRILKHADPYSAKTVINLENEVDVEDQLTETGLRSNEDNEAVATTTENENTWQEISKVLDAKKAELSQEKNKKPSSYKRLKSSAMGPTLLRVRNGL